MTIDLVLFSTSYSHDNPGEYEILADSVSFPHYAHLYVVEGLAKLNDHNFRQNTAQSLIPKICPKAFSPTFVYKEECGKYFAIVHRGRTCHNWNTTLSNSTVGLRECRDLAADAGFKGFIHSEVAPDKGGSKGDVIMQASKPKDEPNCFTHPQMGKLNQIDEDGKPYEKTCDYVPDYGKGREPQFQGWTHQTLAAML